MSVIGKKLHVFISWKFVNYPLMVLGMIVGLVWGVFATIGDWLEELLDAWGQKRRKKM